MKARTLTDLLRGSPWDPSARSASIGMFAVGVLLVVIGLVATAVPVQAEDAFPFDKYPGLGRSRSAALRDDTVAAWEAFRREQSIASCMARAGFAYVPAVAFPSGPLSAVAQGLGVQTAAAATGPTPLERNLAYQAALSAEARERYYQALVGEGATDVAQTQRTGRVPDGRGVDFAKGGCVGEADAAVPSVWTLKLQLNDQLDAARQDIAASAEISAARVAFAECAQQAAGVTARGPDDIDALAATDFSRSDALASVTKACTPVWAAWYRTAEIAAQRRFEQRNTIALLAAQERYRDVMGTISVDQAFLAYLARYAQAQ